MEFRRPFDSRQRAAAARLYKSYRNDLMGIRAKYPAGTAEERRLLKEFHRAAQNFGREAALPNDKVNVAKLNKLARAASEAEMHYHTSRRLRVLDED